MTKPLLVPGHTLAHEGAAHDENGEVLVGHTGYVFRGGSGRAKCSCGELSPPMTSTAQRRGWHRGHKASIRDGCDHESRCCHEHGIHVDPHRGCIFR